MKQCLVLIDIQNDYFPNGKMELHNMADAAEKAKQLLEFFRQRDLPVVHIKHIAVRPDASFFLPQTEGVEINSAVSPIGGEKVIEKNYPNSFRDTGLLDELNDKAIDTLVICGAMSHMCIDATTRAAFDFGFTCVVAEDACATRNLMFNGKEVLSADVHAAFMAALSVPYAKILRAEEIVSAF